MDFLERAAYSALQKTNESIHPRIARNFRKSLRIDVDYMDNHSRQFPEGNRECKPVLNSFNVARPKIASVHELLAEGDFPATELYEYTIALGRPQAFEFISEFSTFKKSMFENYFTAETYTQKFGSAPYTMGRNRLLLTYAEWIHFVGVSVSPQVPSCIVEK